MSKITMATVGSISTNPTSATTTINSNFSTLQTSFDNTLSRDGSSPNQMESNLDMNSFHILNLPEPSSDTDPVRKIDLTNVSTITNLIHTASSTTNTIGTGTLTFTVPSALGFQPGQFVLVQQTGNTANYMGGRIVSYSGTTLTLSITTIGGSGTFSNWTIDVSGAPGATGSTGPQGIPGSSSAFNVYDTRTAAIAATIQGTVNMIRTLAYDTSYTPESGATFTRVAAGTPFIDTWPTSGTINSGSGYTNGTYYGVQLLGSATGSGLIATVTVSGGVVTSVDHKYNPGNSYKVGDVLTVSNAFIGGTGSGFSYTVSTISTPLASFTNSVDGSLWQYVPDKGCTHANQFGAKPDWNDTDVGATNNFAAIQSALFFGFRTKASIVGTYGFEFGQGDTVKLGTGTYLVSAPAAGTMLSIPNGVFLEGIQGTTVKFADGWDAATHCLSIGNSDAHFAHFNCGIRNLSLFWPRNLPVSVGTFLVYSNCVQDTNAIQSVSLFSGQRGCLKYEIGYGGASFVAFKDIAFNSDGGTAQFDCNVGTTLVNCYNWSMGAPSSGENTTAYAINLHGNGGMYDFQNIHMEGFLQGGAQINLVSGNNPQCSFKNVTGGLNIPWVFALVSTNSPGNASFERCQMNNGLGTGLVQNGQSGGLSRTSNILPKDGIVFFNP